MDPASTAMCGYDGHSVPVTAEKEMEVTVTAGGGQQPRPSATTPTLDHDLGRSNTTATTSTTTTTTPKTTTTPTPTPTPTTTPRAGSIDSSRPLSFSRFSSDAAPAHGRSMSNMDAAAAASRKAKRISLTFPINATALNMSRPPSPTRSTLLPTSAQPEGAAALPTAPTDASFLTAVAAQERRVLELKEELLKAEEELKKLKQGWAMHEAQRKRHDAKRLQRLQPLSATAPALRLHQDDWDGSSAWMQQEMERRKALLSGTKTSNRTVFSGSRHARTLSLLSPSSLSAGRFPPANPNTPIARSRSPTAPSRPTYPVRTPTDEVLTREVAGTADSNIDLGLPHDVLLKTGRQMASDFREGLWTFIEDLRQATVGDEAVNGTTTRIQAQQFHPATGERSLRQQPSRASLKPSSARPQPLKRSSTTGTKRSSTRSPAPVRALDDGALLDLGGSFWQEHGLDEPPKIEQRPMVKKVSKKKSEASLRRQSQPQSAAAPTKTTTHATNDSLDGWDQWDSPEQPLHEQKPARSNSDTSVSDMQTSPSPDGTSPRTSIGSFKDGTPQRDSKRDSIPWPALNKLTPSNLRRTASNLMADWERSLTPPPGEDRVRIVGECLGSTKDRKAD